VSVLHRQLFVSRCL